MEPVTVQPSISAKIAQCVEHGSPFLGLQERYFTAEELMVWLKDQPIAIATQVAYKALCTKILPRDQYLPDESSLLAHRPGYVLMSNDLDILKVNTRKDGCGPPISVVFADAHLNKDFDMMKIRLTAQVLNGKVGSRPETLSLTYAGRHFPHVRLNADPINSALLASDWTDKVRYNHRLYALLLSRVTKLQATAPDYYAKVAYKHYYRVARKIYQDNLLTEITQEDMLTFNTFFPSIVNPRLLEYSTLAFNISLLATDLAGYVLGFPIQTGLPSAGQIANALDQLEKMGLKAYAASIAKYVRASQLPLSITPFESENKATICNEEDVLMVKADKYSPFDVVVYRSGEHIFRFTRPEFSNLLKTKKNPWNNEEIPHSVLATIAARHAASKDMGLPKSKTLKEILRNMEADKLFSSGAYVFPTTMQGVRDVLAEIMPILVDQNSSTWGLRNGQGQAVVRSANGDMMASMTATRGIFPPSMAARRSEYSTSDIIRNRADTLGNPAIGLNGLIPTAETPRDRAFREDPSFFDAIDDMREDDELREQSESDSFVHSDDSSDEDDGPPPLVPADENGLLPVYHPLASNDPSFIHVHRTPRQDHEESSPLNLYTHGLIERLRARLQEMSSDDEESSDSESSYSVPLFEEEEEWPPIE